MSRAGPGPSSGTARGPRRSLLALAAAVALLLTACPDDAPPEEPGPEPGNGEPVTLQLVAENISFDQDTLTVPAGAQVTIEFENRDALPHNFSLYETDAAEEAIFQGEIMSQDTTYEFQAPDEPGTHFFRCDPHPTQMQGQFVVE